MSPLRRIAIVGAESTGKSWLAESLTQVLAQRGEAVQWVPEVLRSWCERAGRTPEPHEQMAIAHSQGLDLPWVADGLQRDGPHVRGPVDTMVRQALDCHGLRYRVVYGQGHQRLNNALLALRLPGEDEAAWRTRENAQYALNEGRTPWLCEKCSDADCEHRLFTGLLQRGD